MPPPSISITTPAAPPDWAVLERHVLERLQPAAVEFVEKYTRDDGTYTIYDLPPGTYQVIFSYISYETSAATDVVVKPRASTIVNRAMVLSAIEGETIEVRPRYFAEEATGSVSTVNLSREEIRRFPGGLEDVVRTVLDHVPVP